MLALALTYDDGPDAEWTPRLLDALHRARATATFFPIAPRAAAHPDLIARMLAEGHTVGLHCDDHVRHTDRDEPWLVRDTARALARLRAAGARPTLWRTPWGVTAPFSESVARAHGLRITGWTVDTHDWRGDTAEAMLDATRDHLRPGAIVLAHDGVGPGARRSDAAQTIAYTELVAQQLRDTDVSLEALA